MKRIMVIGCPGAGKSTFSRSLREKLGLPLFYLDMIWHKPNKTTVSREEFDRKLGEIVKREAWIIDGNYGRTLEIRLQKCDTVFVFDLPTEECLKGAESRIGRKREDMPWIENEIDLEFKEWIIGFSKNEMPQVYEKIEKYKDKTVVIFKSRKEADDFLKSISTEQR